MRTDYPALGFIPDTTIAARYVAKNSYILQSNEKGNSVGYMLHGAIHYGEPVVITQAMIDYDYRLRGYGESAIKELISRAERGGASAIKLRCATDLSAVAFWKACGFIDISYLPGGQARNRMIVKFIKPLSLPLFEEVRP
jgi:GNAT superfamily N-acetyltransferase